MDIDSYCLPDWPPESIQNLKIHQSKSAKSPRHILLSSKHDDSIINNEFLQPSEREEILRRFSARRSEGKLIFYHIIYFYFSLFSEYNIRHNNRIYSSFE